MKKQTSARQTIALQIALMAILAFGLAMPLCPDSDHLATAAHPFACTGVMPQLFELLILTNVLLLATVTSLMTPQAATFPLLKPPRLAALLLKAR